MKKWIALIIVLFIIVIWTSIDTYRTANEFRTKQGEEAIQVAQAEEPDLVVDDISFYNGNQSYTILYGRVDGEVKIYCVPNGKGEIIVVDPTKGISADEAVQKLAEERNPLSIKSVNLGIEQDVPIWEIIYLDQKNRYSYYYITFKDGEFIKRYTL